MSAFASLRELLVSLDDPGKFWQLPEEIQDLEIKQAVACLRLASTALLKISQLNDETKVAPKNLKNARYLALMALKNINAVATDIASLEKINGRLSQRD